MAAECDSSPDGKHDPVDGIISTGQDSADLRKVCSWCGKNLGR